MAGLPERKTKISSQTENSCLGKDKGTREPAMDLIHDFRLAKNHFLHEESCLRLTAKMKRQQ